MKKNLLLLLFLISSSVLAQTSTAETIVQKQVEAYNRKDIEAFLSFYSEDVKIFNFPNKLETEGKKQMRESYTPFFNGAKVLNCKIVKRIVRNNTVIDEELVKYNDTEFSGVAIYEVENDKIIRVTFIN